MMQMTSRSNSNLLALLVVAVVSCAANLAQTKCGGFRSCCCPYIPNNCKVNDCENVEGDIPLPQYCDCSTDLKANQCGKCVNECEGLGVTTHIAELWGGKMW